MRFVATVLCFTLFTLSGETRGESVNIDIGVMGGVPDSTYAAAGLAGSWNGIPISAGQPVTIAPALVELNGVTSDVSLTIRPVAPQGETTGFGTVDRYPSLDDYRLLHDQLNTFIWLPFSEPYGSVFDFDGLDDGRYDVITYTTATAVTNVQTVVSVNDDPTTARSVDGSFRYPLSGLVEGVTHVVHRNVPVGNDGVLRVLAHSTPQSDASFVNGFQLMPSTVICDFDGDADCDAMDINDLVAAIVTGQPSPLFDLTNDGTVNREDIRDPTLGWLRLAGEQHLGPGRSYREGDANLDGAVDGADFLAWNLNKFMPGGSWTEADFDATGTTDGGDFVIWNANKFTAGALPVPEPSWVSLLICGVLVVRSVHISFSPEPSATAPR